MKASDAMTIELTRQQLHEIVTALHHNRGRIHGRMRRTEAKIVTPPHREQQKQAEDPMRLQYLTTLLQCRRARLATIDALLGTLEIYENDND